MRDTTGSIDSVIFFPDQYREYKNALYEGNVVIVKGNKSKTEGLIVEKMFLAKS